MKLYVAIFTKLVLHTLSLSLSLSPCGVTWPKVERVLGREEDRGERRRKKGGERREEEEERRKEEGGRRKEGS